LRKLNIGCGDHPLDGWINTDIALGGLSGPPFMDARRTFPFPDAHFDRVFSEHMIEHITYPEGKFMLSECFRVLKPGGRIRISTPNLGFLINLWQDGDADEESLLGNYIRWAGKHWGQGHLPNACTVVNNFVRAWGHLFLYDAYTLARTIADVGFKLGTNGSFHNINESPDPHFRNLENDARCPPGFLQLETMTIEAEKP
jgi:predicted SAM-dependent methyltransferase